MERDLAGNETWQETKPDNVITVFNSSLNNETHLKSDGVRQKSQAASTASSLLHVHLSVRVINLELLTDCCRWVMFRMVYLCSA
jgi:hypothetical protein